jgi:quinol-cytochrome oxidoreductase complex cytochrome b subunit
MGRANFFLHLHPPSIPADQARFRHTFGLGGLAVFLTLVTALTGALLMFYYAPSPEQANPSLYYLRDHVPYGWLLRNLHFWAAQSLLVVAGLHLLRVLFTAAYRKSRRFNWLLGLALLVILMAEDFSGYVLRWDDQVGWALLVGANLLRQIPLFGQGLYRMAVGGAALGEGTLLRFYGWHVLGLGAPLLFLMGWHLFRLRRDGGIAHPEGPGRPRARIRREQLAQREGVAMLVAAGLLLLLAAFASPALSGPLDLGQMAAREVRAPWFFLWVQELLRHGQAAWMGLGIPLGILALLALLPYGLDRGAEAGIWFPRDGRLAQGLGLLLAVLMGGLTLLGALR